MATGQGNYFDAESLYNDCLTFLPEIEAVLAKLEASLYELVQVITFLNHKNDLILFIEVYRTLSNLHQIRQSI